MEAMYAKEFENFKSGGNSEYYLVCMQYRNKGKWLVNVFYDRGLGCTVNDDVAQRTSHKRNSHGDIVIQNVFSRCDLEVVIQEMINKL